MLDFRTSRLSRRLELDASLAERVYAMIAEIDGVKVAEPITAPSSVKTPVKTPVKVLQLLLTNKSHHSTGKNKPLITRMNTDTKKWARVHSLCEWGRVKQKLCKQACKIFAFFCQSQLDGIIRAHLRNPWLVLLQPRPARGLLKEKPDLSLAELTVLIGKSVSAVERASAKLVKAGKLRRIGPAKGGHWEVDGKSEG
jgi:hypothetical protein